MSVNIYYDSDADLDVLKRKRVCIVGYGSQGHAHAQNLNESGVDVVVGLRPGSATFSKVEADGVKALPLADALSDADVICLLLPDTAQAAVYREQVAPALRPGKTLLFAHGFNVHYNQIVAPEGVDVILVAPKSPGKLVRELYRQGAGTPCLLAVERDASGEAKATALAYAKGIGGTKAGVIETTFREETETDLFGEQAVLCGGCSSLIKAGFETLVEAGYSPEMAYFECLHELKLIVDLIYRGGLKHMREFISETATYGDITRGPMVIDEDVRDTMREILDDIQSGEFAREWILETQANRPVYTALMRKEAEHPIEETGEKLRGMMGWLKDSK